MTLCSSRAMDEPGMLVRAQTANPTLVRMQMPGSFVGASQNDSSYLIEPWGHIFCTTDGLGQFAYEGLTF